MPSFIQTEISFAEQQIGCRFAPHTGVTGEINIASNQYTAATRLVLKQQLTDGRQYDIVQSDTSYARYPVCA